MKTGVELISEERTRQINEEGWTSEHDDDHTYEQMALAAAAYINPPGARQFANYSRDIKPSMLPLFWPWDPQWWKPCTTFLPVDTDDVNYLEGRVRELTKGAALAAAEIDRLNRRIELIKKAKGE